MERFDLRQASLGICALQSALIDSEVRNFRIQGLRWNSESLGGTVFPSNSSARRLQCGLNYFSFALGEFVLDLREHPGPRKNTCRGSCRFPLQPCLVDRKCLSLTEDHGAFYYIL